MIAEEHRPAVLAAISAVADPKAVSGISPTTPGASGASTLRVDIGSDAYLLRIDPVRRGFQDPSRSYPCHRVAAAAGIAPAVHHADEEAGVMLTDFVVERPLSTYPGGEPALLRSLGEMVARLQATERFPPVTTDFGELVDALLRLIRDSGLFAMGVLDGHVAGLTRLRAAYPRPCERVSAHNDVNPRNVLFDGARLWLVDWELAFGNDPLADVANISNNFSDLPDASTLVLEGWMSGPPDDDTRHRLALMQDLHRLFSGCLLLTRFIGQRETEPELTALTPDEFRAAIARGELKGTPELPFVLGKMHLVEFAARHGS
jgi:aminoglycoside phosphotransferase (APT) family kinase protein